MPAISYARLAIVGALVTVVLAAFFIATREISRLISPAAP
jgi:hypothetical protein